MIKINGNFTDKDKTIEFPESRGFAIEQSVDNFELGYLPFYWVGAKRNICRIRRIRGNKTIGQSHEDYRQRGNLNTENADAVIISSNKFKIGYAVCMIYQVQKTFASNLSFLCFIVPLSIQLSDQAC